MQARSALCFAPSLVIDHHYVSNHSVFEFRCTASLISSSFGKRAWRSLRATWTSMLGSRAVRACMSKSSTSAFDFAYSSLARRGAPNCIRMNPRSRCASGMLGSSSTVYNEQPTSAEMLPSRARTEIGYEANIQQFDQNPTYKRVCRAHPHTYGKTPALTSSRLSTRAHPRAYGENSTPAGGASLSPSTFTTPAKVPLGGPPPLRWQAARAR